MKSMSLRVFGSLFLFAMSAQVWAGAVDEVAALLPERAKAFSQGDLDTYVGAFADNAVLNPGLQGLRVEGQSAIRQYFTEAFQSFPKRQFSVRQASARAYNEDAVVQNLYGILRVTNDQGISKAIPSRLTIVWAKLGGRWRIVQQHNSSALIADQ